MREHAELLTHLLAAPEDGLEPLVVLGQGQEDPLDLLVDRRGQEAQRLDGRRLGAECGVVRVRAEHGVHLAGHLAEPAQSPQEPLRVLADLVEREVPAVEPVADVFLEDAESRSERTAGVCVPPTEGRDVRETVLGQEAQHLELRVDARLEPAEHLEDQLLVEDDRAVRLLRADRTHLAQLAPEPGEALDRRELHDPLGALHRQAGTHRAHELAGEL